MFVLLDKPIDRFNIKNRFNPCRKTVIKTVLDNTCDLIKLSDIQRLCCTKIGQTLSLF
ncbi:hypothetical protein HMPREF9373_0022 [Psychrobacter sp. 1501(2011)]|nr:hypothetical protein HMPREF9373_0022 [Psychrobacter sp. 1501(2011)]